MSKSNLPMTPDPSAVLPPLRVSGLRMVARVSAALVVSLMLAAEAADWPQYRGPNHDGVSTETIRTTWAQEPPRLLWKVPLDPGLSSFAISGGRAFTMVSRRANGADQEFCVALDANTGRELWATRVDLADYPNGGVGFDDGPRSTPTVEGDRVYALGAYLRVACLNAATGAEIWSKDLLAEFGGDVIAWQNAASPLLVGNLIFINCNAPGGRLLALRKQDGSVAWRAHEDRMTQATPVAATIANVPQVIFFAQSGLVSIAPETGATLWRYPFSYSTSTAASPVVAGDVVYCSAAYGRGAGAARITSAGGQWRATQLWKTPGANMNHWATPVEHGGFLYGIYGQSFTVFRCLDVATGEAKWSRDGVGTGGVIKAGDHLLVLAEEGEVWLVKPNPAAYTELARFQVVSGKCWNVPAISDGRLYVRSTTEAAAYDIAVKSVPKGKLRWSSAALVQNGFRFSLASEDAAPIDRARAAGIEVFTSTDLRVWTRLAVQPVLTNGELRLEVDKGTGPDQGASPQFFRAQERP